MKKKLLIIDDDPSICDLIKEMLEFEDLSVITSSTAEEGLVKAKYKSPDIILLDLFLPKMNGFDVYKNLKSDDRTKDIPVIIITGHTDANTIRLADELGLSGIFYKPFHFGRMRKKIKAVLKNDGSRKSTCNNCGRELDESWNFCPYDGLGRNN